MREKGHRINQTFEEINVSVYRYCRYCLGIDSCYILVCGEKEHSIFRNNFDNNKVNSSKVENSSFNKFFEEFKKNPLPFFIVGHEKTLMKEVEIEDLFKRNNAKQFSYFYKIFPEICGYFGSPFNPGLVRAGKKDLKDFNKINKLLDEVEALYTKIKKSFKDADDLENFFKEAGQYFGKDPEEREEISHAESGKSQGIRNSRIQVANLIAGIVGIKNMKKNEKVKLLLIDNDPTRKLIKIDQRFVEVFENKEFAIINIFELFRDFIETYIYEYEDKTLPFKSFVEKLKRAKQEDEPKIELSCKRLNGVSEIKNLNDFDLILVDMYLGKDEPDGIEILHQLTDVFPQIPAFVLSVSDDFEVMHRAAEVGADYYIIKNQTFSIPYAYCKYLENIGEILKDFDDAEYQKNLLGNIRYWKFKKSLLWFGDKCYHMIEHAYNHTLDDWNHMNAVLVPLMKEEGREKYINDDLLYAFCMALWLHDIGHKGSDVHGEPHLIRDNHGYISGELILRYPKLFRIKDFRIRKMKKGTGDKKEIDDYYNHNSIDFSKVSAVEMIYDREDIDDLSTTEMIALISMFHKSNTPLDWAEYKNLLQKRKVIPAEYYIEKDRKDKNILTLEKILDKRLRIEELRKECEKSGGQELNVKLNEREKIKENFLRLTALFRFIDSIDIRNIRVGDVTEKGLKEAVITNDAKYQFRKLEREIKNLSKNYTPVESALFVKNFYQDVREEIETGEFTELKLPKDLLKDQQELENYEALVDYASFIELQKSHFDLHSSIKEIRFEYQGNKRLDITLITDKEKSDLESVMVRERGKKQQSVYDRLIGKRCYVLEELEGAKRYLKEFFEQVRIRLENDTSGQIYGERLWQ